MPSRLLSSVLVLLATATLALPTRAASSEVVASTPRAYHVAAAGPHVERGTSRVQVRSKLGAPTMQISPGMWIYRGFTPVAPGKAAEDCRLLIVYFRDGWVSDLKLANGAGAEFLIAQHDPARAATAVVATAR